MTTSTQKGGIATSLAAGSAADGVLARCVTPLEPEAAGEDPRHGDRFAAVQGEVSRLSGTDFDALASGCLNILAEEAKDLRVLGYLALAEVARAGVQGLAGALELTAAVVERFGDSIHPRRATARESALRFLDTERLAALLARADDADDAAARARLQAAADDLTRVMRSALAVEEPRLSRISEWLQRRASEQPAPLRASASERAPASANATPSASGGETSSDTLDLHASMRALLAALREGEHWPEHLALARAYRWAALRTPPARDDVTRIEPPRAAALAAVESACAEQRWAHGLAAAERAFLEPGGQYCLRIQRLAARCAERLDRPALARRIENEVGLLRAYLPGLEALCFSDGTPFADTEDRVWLDRLTPPTEPAPESAACDDRLARARERLDSEDLGDVLQSLEAGRPAEGRALAETRLLQAELCLGADRADAARPLLEGVLDGLQRGGHDLWDRELTARTLRRLLRATERDAAQHNDARRRRIAQLREQLARLDVSAALAHAGGAARKVT